MIYLVRGCSSAGETSSSDEFIRIIVWAREAVRGAKVTSLSLLVILNFIFSLQDAGQFVIAVCELSGQMLVYDHQKYLDIQPEEISMAMQEATRNQFRKLQQDARMLFQ